MVPDGFNELILKVRGHVHLSPADKKYVQETLPQVLGVHRSVQSFRYYQHPAGRKIAGAPSRTFLKSYALILAKRVFGTKGFTGQPLYDEFEQSLTLGIMRSHFEHGAPKGFYCCRLCSLAVFPLYKLDLLHYLTCKPLAQDMRCRIEGREGAFSKGLADNLVEFTLGF